MKKIDEKLLVVEGDYEVYEVTYIDRRLSAAAWARTQRMLDDMIKQRQKENK